MMHEKTADGICRLDNRIHEATSQFHNSSVAATVFDPVLGPVAGDENLTVADLVLVAILSGVHILITGPTGRGKTDLVKLICQGVFGDDWFLLRLNPHLNEETFANIEMDKLATSNLRDAVSPAPFLAYGCTILDELNRTPSALTNILLGFCDGRIELKCGLKYDVGHHFRNGDGREQTYHVIIGTMNEGQEYCGTFQTDPALARRFTLQIPLDTLHPTPGDLVEIIDTRIGNAQAVHSGNVVDELTNLHSHVLGLPFDPLAVIYLLYLANVGRCYHSPTGYHPLDSSQELCTNAQCRIQKINNGFCPSVSGLSEGVLIFLKRAACGMAALRSARSLQRIQAAFELDHADQIDQLANLLDVHAPRKELRTTIIGQYLKTVKVSVADLKALLPYVGLGGRVWLSKEYVAKHFFGSPLLAMREYVRLTYAGLLNFFVQQQKLIQELAEGNGSIGKIRQRLEHAEKFSDPYIRHTIEPLLARRRSGRRSPHDITQEIEVTESARDGARQLLD